ncbi:MAG: hypothetical protein GYA41_04025 [Bacteroidales bacterium]|nr:hypothetical protein [Bacteroidales bacterium]
MDLPQNHFLNPALRPSNRVYVGLPVITGINVNISNSVFNFSDIFSEGLEVSESTIPFINSDYDLDKFMGRIKKFNYFDTRTSFQLLGAGFTVNNDLYVFLDITDNFISNIVVPGDFFELAFRGNDKFYGTTLDLTNLDLDLRYYREVGAGFSKTFADRLRFGVKGKLLFGIAAASLENNLLNINIVDDNSHTFNTDMIFNFSGPLKFYPVSDTDPHFDDVEFDEDRFNDPGDYVRYMTNMKNMGFGLDLGAEFKVTEKIFASMAITDLGYIRWKSDITSLKTDDQIVFSGLNMEEVYDGTASFEDVGEAMIDSVRSSLSIIESPDPFLTMLPAGLTLAGKYALNDYLSFGLLSYSKLAGKQVKEALTLSANLNLGGFFSTTIAWTAGNRSYDNLGFGLAIRGLYAQMYFLVDRIPLTWSKANLGGDSFPFPDKWNTLNARMGFNLVFGNKRGRIRE